LALVVLVRPQYHQQTLMALLVQLVEQVFLEQATAMLKHLAVLAVGVEVPLT
jgi:hypothetical protein